LRAEGADVERAKRFIEQTIHFAVHSKERIALAVVGAHVSRAVVPGNEIT